MTKNHGLAVVGYLDLLGFSSAMMSMWPSANRLIGEHGNFGSMKKASQKAIQEYGITFEPKWLSDSCAVYSFLDDWVEDDKEKQIDTIARALDGISAALGIIQSIFGSSRYFSRGGIALGPILEDESGEPFGPGLVQAVKIEGVLSEYPKVALSGGIAAAGMKLKVKQNGRNMFLHDLPLPTLDYLSFAEAAAGKESPEYVLAYHAEQVHEFVEVSYKVPALREKATWLLKYHNWHVKSREGLNRLIIPLDPPDILENGA